MASKTKPKVKRKKRRKQQYTVGKDGPRTVDVHVGRRLRERRVLVGLSLEELGDRVGLTYQQVQKYETGFNRMGASRLWEMSHILGVPVAWFFEGIGRPGRKMEPHHTKRETLELVRAYSSCSKEVQNRLIALLRTLAEPEGKK